MGTANRDDAERERLSGIVKDAAEKLGEIFENVQVFVSRHEGEETGARAISWGLGNIYAREGQVSRWLEQDIKPCVDNSESNEDED